MDFNNYTNQSCTPTQIINLNVPLNKIDSIEIYDNCCKEYDINSLKYAYSLDNLCWSNYMEYNEFMTNIFGLNQDFYVRIKIQGYVDHLVINGELYIDYSTQLSSDFSFTGCDVNGNSNVFNPYANMDCAINLYQQLSETVSCIVGIPCYYIKLKPDANSKDLTFKEYTLMNVDAIKYLKIIIQDNEMPSSKPEFADWGLDFQTDWEVEITKGSFATAFGNTAQPMEGDLVYIPMMKRMWMLTGAYEEKKDGFMWIASTFKLSLTKYQEKDSVDLGDAQSFVDSLVKNKYEDLFGEDEQSTLDSGTDSLDAPRYAANNLYPVFESDATRSYITCDSLNIIENSIYFRGTLVSDSKYRFLNNLTHQSRILYQKKYCGDSCSISFIIEVLESYDFEGILFSIGNLKFKISVNGSEIYVYPTFNPELKIKLQLNNPDFVIIKWDKNMNIFDMTSYEYTFNQRIPVYKVQNQHYYFDIDNPISTVNSNFNMELEVTELSTIELNNFFGTITNFKLFDLYNDNVSELLQMYPTHQHLLINDTARRLVDLPGVKPT